MRRIFLSEMDVRAPQLARLHGLGVELIGFCDAVKCANEALIAGQAAGIAGLADASLHAPFYEIFPSAIDPMMRAAGMVRMQQAAQVCKRLGVRRMVVHSGDLPQVYYPEWFVPRSIEFWRELMQSLPPELEIEIENVLDLQPESLAAICDGIGDGRARICLDVGHAHVHSAVAVEDWIEILGPRIGHVHLHNNSGARDEHAALGCGSLNIEAVLGKLDACAPEAAICIESVDAAACLQFLFERGYL